MPELVDLVNKTNARLLYQSLLANLKNNGEEAAIGHASEPDREYELLNAFEMLWNVLGNNTTNEDDKSL